MKNDENNTIIIVIIIIIRGKEVFSELSSTDTTEELLWK